MTTNNDQELFDDLSCQSAPERTSAAAARLRRRSDGRWRCVRFVSMNSFRRIIAFACLVLCRRARPDGVLVGIKAVEGRPGHPRPILASCWRCGFTQRSRAWRARGKWRGCARSMSRFMAVRRVGVNAKTLAIFGSGMERRWSNFSSTVLRR